MIRLGVDLSIPEGSVAVAQGSNVLAQSSWNRPKIHSEVVFLKIDEILKTAGFSREDIAEVVVTSGPGSFTGVRLSVSLGKAFKECGKKVLSATTLSALSAGYENIGFTPIPVIWGRRGRVYAEVKGELLDVSPSELSEKLSEVENPLIVYKGELPKELSKFPNIEENTPLAVKLLKIKEELLLPLRFHYVREHDAKPQT
ncbi:MAG: tRNA (adenosine(37)-N6)-threonylcarbamoyltransferase complex dimerization subunit type 1 TsaB [Thermovibrio sp.]|nr:MAG: tRNA (adenosine(37)-N6)-threonylcarbamoyltransferase complex dimerization subunit type 1 TsaB [Thermovibrio sp.]